MVCAQARYMVDKTLVNPNLQIDRLKLSTPICLQINHEEIDIRTRSLFFTDGAPFRL